MISPLSKHTSLEPLELADTLHHQADEILARIQLSEIVQPYGPLTLTGSYYLNVMVYPDVDVYLPKVTVEQLFDIGGLIARHDDIVQVVFEQGDPSMPGGLYLKARIATGNWGRPWKLDLWSLDDDLRESKMAPMRRFLSRITPAFRQQIIRYKLSIMTSNHRTPMYSGYFIYKAFLDEGFTDFDQITHYLIQNGIKLEAQDH